MKFSHRLNNLLGLAYTKFYLDSFRFDSSVVRCLGGYFFPDTVTTCNVCLAESRQNSSALESAPNKLRESLPFVGLDLPSLVISARPQLYTAQWDCRADTDNELSFDKGERLLVVSHQYEHLGWLVAQTTAAAAAGGHSKRTGLVPKNYVTRAS